MVVEEPLVSTEPSSSLPPLPTASQPMGFPLPRDEHACSVSLPTWSSVVGYEEGNQAVTSAMLCGYPRFVYHPYIQQLQHYIVQTFSSQQPQQPQDCLVLPTREAALRCQAFLQLAWEQQAQSSSNTTKVELVDNAYLSSQTCTEPVSSSNIQCVEVVPNYCHAVLFPAEAAPVAKAYWQHTGEVVSSRRAFATLQRLGLALDKTVTQEQHICHPAHLTTTTTTTAEQQQQQQQEANDNGCDKTSSSIAVASQLRQRIAQWAHVPSEDQVFLTPSGMAAIYQTLRSARRRHYELNPTQQGGRSIVYGFPYLDTLKLCSRTEFCPAGVNFYGKGDATDLEQFKAYLEQNPDSVSNLFTEVPSNPLLHCPDLYALRDLANQYNFVLAVDDTISNFLNVNLIESGLADVVCTSLTKLVSGRGDSMAGSCVVNHTTRAGQWILQDLLQTQTDQENQPQQNAHDPTSNGLFCPDALAVLRNSTDFVQRSAAINETAEQMADWFVHHPDVERVYYPKYSPSVNLYHQVQWPRQPSSNNPEELNHPSGYGGLMSIILHPHVCQRTFYDALDVAKGPSLGTNFTLVCPYTLLAHYHELDFAKQYDVPPNLIRISIGLESAQVLKQKFESALNQSRLYPKVTDQDNSTSTNDDAAISR